MSLTRIFPERVAPHAPRSEVVVYEALRATLDDSFVVFHSVAWHRAERNHPDGEIDFLIAHPELGAMVLEVKGGGIEYNPSGGWASTEGGRRHRMDSPFEQAKRAKHALIGEIKEDVRWPTGRSVQMGWAVVFPGIPITSSGFTAEGKREVTLGKNDLKNLGEVVVGRLRYWQGVEPRDPLGEDGIGVLVERYGRTWRHEVPLKDVVAEEVRRIVELTEQQMDAFRILARQRRAAIAGCAGSGKTLIAVSWAKELAQAGDRILPTCFNRGLADHWERTLELPDRVMAMNYHQFCSAAVRRNAVTSPPGLAEADYMNWIASYGLLEAAEKDLELRFDGIIVDEAQDFEADWFGALEACLSGPEARFFVFYDDNQRLYGEERVPASFGTPFLLGRNVRNPDPIGELVRQFYPGAMRLSEVSGEPVQPIVAEKREDRTSDEVGLKWVFESLRKQGADPADVVVLSPVSDEDSRLFRRGRFGSWSLYRRQKPEGDVLFETIRSFKGQDRPIVILAELDQLKVRGENAKEALASLLYVGCSRATNRLYLLTSEPWVELLKSLGLEPIRVAQPG
jgi:hypothetical protein